MSATVADAFDELLEALAAAGISLQVRGVKLIITPAAALTPALAARVRERKATLTRWARLNSPCEVCGSREYIDVPIHDGRSVRRDCACNRTLGHPVWYGVAVGGLT